MCKVVLFLQADIFCQVIIFTIFFFKNSYVIYLFLNISLSCKELHHLIKSTLCNRTPLEQDLGWSDQVIGDFSSYFTKIMAEYVIKVGKRTVDLQIGSVLFAALCSSVPCGLKFSEGIGLLCWIYITDVIWWLFCDDYFWICFCFTPVKLL